MRTSTWNHGLTPSKCRLFQSPIKFILGGWAFQLRMKLKRHQLLPPRLQWNEHPLIGFLSGGGSSQAAWSWIECEIKAVLQEAVPFQSVGFPSPTALSISVLPPVSNFQTKEQVAVSPHCLTPAGTQPHGVQKKSNALFESLSIFP